MFANTLALVDDADLSVLHVFPFSPRKGTPAQRMPQVERALVKERAARLRAKGSARLAQRLAAMVGREETVLIEKPGFGRTPCFAPVSFEGEFTAGSFARMRMAGAGVDHLIAVAV
jgi:threonylcarbamoyladenosine tRNA methylthiotransferase MtaB